MTLLINDVFTTNGQTYRYLAIHSTEDYAYVIRLGAPKTLPFRWRLAELNALATNGKSLRVISLPAETRPLGAKDCEVRNRRWARIRDLVDNPNIFDKETRGPLLRQYARSIGVSKETLLADLRAWWVGGQIPDALLGDYYLSGRVDETADGAAVFKEKSESGVEMVVFAPAKGAARGRRPKDKRYQPLALPAELRKAILDVAWSHVSSDASKSRDGAVTRVLSELFSLRGEDGEPLRDEEGAAVLRPLGSRPTAKQVRYLLTKTKPLSVLFRKRNSPAEYANNHAPRTGTVLNDTLGPGDVFEVDSTLIDLHVVAKANRAKVIGKATLYLVIDRHCRLIVGFHISLENPSWSEAANAILSIAGDWEALCKRLRIRYDPRDWPAQGRMPNRFFADRADMITGASDALCEGIHTQITNAVALMSADKAIVESGFKTIHQPLRQFAPGYEPPEKYMKRRAKHYWKDASLNLDELAATMLRLVINHNRLYKTGFDANPGQILSGENLAPRDLWAKLTQQRMGLGARMPIDVLRRRLLPMDDASVEHDGVHFRHCVYEAPEIKEWFVRASMRGSFPVRVSFTSNLVDTVVVHHPTDGARSYVASLTPKSKKFAGYSFAEVHAVMVVKADNVRNAEDKNRAHKVATYQDMQTIFAPAAEETRAATKGMQPGSRFYEAPEARLEEAHERRYESHDLSVSPKPYHLPESEPVAAEGAVSSSEPRATDAGPGVSARDAQPPDISDAYEMPAADANDRLDTAPQTMTNLLKLINSVSSEEKSNE